MTKTNLTPGALLLLAATLGLSGAGCKKQAVAPTPVAAEEVAPTVEKAFQQSAPEVRQSASVVVAAVQSGDDGKALDELTELSVKPELTPEQRQAVTRSMLGVHQRLRAAAEKGDKTAEATLEHYRATK